MLSSLGNFSLALLGEFGDATLFTARSYAAISSTRAFRPRLIRSIFEQGVRCVPVIGIVGIFTGLVLGLQGYYVLLRFGSEALLGTLVSLTLTRELGPVLAALMVVGQAGSALAAELGIQRNSEQIDALETMGADPLGYLIAPRMVAALITYPILTGFFTLIGLVGGFVSASVVLSLQSGIYWSAVFRAIQPRDLTECMVKATVFGVITTAICCHSGYNAHRRAHAAGARAVSTSTTRAVVLSSVAVLAADYVITSLLVISHHG